MSFKGSLARPLVWPTEPEPRLKALPYWAPRRNHLSLKAQELAGFALRAIAGRAAASDPYAESANLRVVNSATLRPRPRPRQTSSQRPVFYRAPMRPVPPEFAAPLLTFALAPSPWAPPPEVVPLEVAPSEVAPSDIKLEESAIIKSDNIISANILSDSQITPAPNDLGLSQEPPLAKKAPRQFRPWVWVLGLALVAVALAWGVAKKIELNSAAPTAPEVKTEGLVGAQPAEANLGSTEAAEVLPLAKKDLARYLGARLIDEKDPRFLTALGPDQDQLIAETTLDPKLQDQANQWLAKTRASQAALVVMNPLDGQVLTLAGYRRDGAPLNAALTDPLPAASLFKIITATAAMEKADYEANTLVAYDGGKHTLYRGNVLKKPDVGRHKTTLKEGFADSNNAVFGKLGAFDLGSEELVTYANRFYFNQPIDFEMKWEPSEFSLAQEEEDLFRLAEIASGYNRETKATALHGAMLAATVIAEGVMMEPTLVREAFDKDNKILYRSQAKSLGQVMSPQTAKELSELMEAAVSLGTGRRHFWDAESHPLLSGLVIGGKSGTMNDEEGRRVEWFVAYSYWPEPNSGPMWPLALAAVVANEGKTAPDSQELIRRALIAYYQPLLDGTGRVYK